jgi:hypothetical protein
VLAAAGAAVARETQASHSTKLRKVGAHLLFVEAMRDTAGRWSVSMGSVLFLLTGNTIRDGKKRPTLRI